MACAVAYTYTIFNSGLINARLQIDATNTPLFCELEFFIDTTVVDFFGTHYFPANDVVNHPNVNFFSAWRVSVDAPFVTNAVFGTELGCITFNTPNGDITTCPQAEASLATGNLTAGSDSNLTADAVIASLASGTLVMDLTGSGKTQQGIAEDFASSPAMSLMDSGGRSNIPIVDVTLTDSWKIQQLDMKIRQEEKA